MWHKRKLADIDREALEGFLFPGSKAAFRDMIDKHATWQLETNNEPFRYPYSAQYDIPQNEDGCGWDMLACGRFPTYIGNQDHIPNAAHHILAPISMGEDEVRTGRDVWNSFNELLECRYGEHRKNVVRSFDLCIDFKTSHPLEERCRQETAEMILSINQVMWNIYVALSLPSLVVHMRAFKLSGKRLRVFMRTFMVVDEEQPLNDTSTPALVEDISDALDGAEEQLDEFEDLLVASGLGTIEQTEGSDWIRYVCELAAERYHNKGRLTSAQYAAFLKRRNTSSA